MVRKKMLFIYNPKAGKEQMKLDLSDVLSKLVAHGFEVTVHPTQYSGDAYDTALQRGSHYQYLVCSGGDGTLSEVIGALMRVPKCPILGYIPSGSTNDYAVTLGLPMDPLTAAQNICEGVPIPVDIGRFGGKYFSYIAAFGLFTDVSYDTRQDLKNLLGHAAYMLEGVKRLANITSQRCTVWVDGKKITHDFVLGFVSNSTSIGGFKLLSGQDMQINDGLFEVVLLKKITRFTQLQEVIGVLMGNGKSCDNLLTFQADHIHLSAEKEMKWTLDGEYGGMRQHVTIRNLHNAIQIIVPASM